MRLVNTLRQADQKPAYIGFCTSSDLKKRLQTKAAQQGMSLSLLINMILERAIELDEMNSPTENLAQSAYYRR
ncbi:MAG: hypothetical protein DRH11_13170 [Deltaproteobacteria bacterium]|nr:hypothetical protein [Deltaproteobacteria bacterium]RLB31532.1 MAG: hypothetical protein DRH11_13170 [Deltaproteobacteria bacterium]